MCYDYISTVNTHDEHVVSNFSQGKRTNITNYNCKLKKYNAKPVHSFNEFMELKNVHIPDNISLFGGYIQDDLVAGSVVFYFPKTKTLHTQYLCAKEEFAKLSPMSFMYYSMIGEAKKINYKKLSWGISTENLGRVLNQGLLKNKEAYGSTYSVNKTFYKEL